MPVDLWPVMQHRMADYRASAASGASMEADPKLERACSAEVRDRGASTARDLDDGLPRVKENWGWNWSDTRKVLDYLFMVGRPCDRRTQQQFEVLYDLPSGSSRRRCSPADPERRRGRRRAGPPGGEVPRGRHRSRPARLLPDAHAAVKPAIDVLVESGELLPVAVEGWNRPAYLHRDAQLPRRVDARAVLSPFDPVVWERERTERLFDFHYRIEIYVPAESGSTATTCCRSCSATGSSPASTSRPTASGVLLSRRRTPSPARRRDRRRAGRRAP